jgi:hypothetical protein
MEMPSASARRTTCSLSVFGILRENLEPAAKPILPLL